MRKTLIERLKMNGLRSERAPLLESQRGVSQFLFLSTIFLRFSLIAPSLLQHCHSFLLLSSIQNRTLIQCNPLPPYDDDDDDKSYCTLLIELKLIL